MQQNGDLAQNISLKQVWKQLAHMNREDCLLGIKFILGIVNNNGNNNNNSNESDRLQMNRSDCVHMPWIDFPNGTLLKVYR